MNKKSNTGSRFLNSAFIEDGVFCSCNEALEWINEIKRSVGVNIELTQLSKLKDWNHNKSSGQIEHITGKFFSIEGIDININTTDGNRIAWSQPIINQPEIGYLGCIVKEFKGILYFLVQAKIEPGNENVVQISPTLQATRSNYTMAHKGNAPKFLDYFNTTGKSKVLVDQLQSEQGARFLSKRNRNIIVEIEEDIKIPNEFQWLTLGQIKKLAGDDNVVNMDLRTVISCIPFNEANTMNSLEEGSYQKIKLATQKNNMLDSALSQNSHETIVNIISWITELKSKTDLFVNKARLEDLKQWEFNDYKISHQNKSYFDVLWVSVEIMNREVARWDQPIIAPCGIGIIGFIVKKINNIYHFLVQAEIECGNLDIYELGPTVSCVETNHQPQSVPFLDYISSAKEEQVLYRAMQSEEGGRFFHEQNLNIIVEADDNFKENIPSNFKWMTLNQLLFFIKFNNIVNIGARSLLAGVRFK